MLYCPALRSEWYLFDRGFKFRKVNTYQVIDSQKQGLDAAIALAIPAGSDAQINPHQLGQELQGEASQAVFGAPVQLEQLVAHRLQELDHR